MFKNLFAGLNFSKCKTCSIINITAKWFYNVSVKILHNFTAAATYENRLIRIHFYLLPEAVTGGAL